MRDPERPYENQGPTRVRCKWRRIYACVCECEFSVLGQRFFSDVDAPPNSRRRYKPPSAAPAPLSTPVTTVDGREGFGPGPEGFGGKSPQILGG